MADKLISLSTFKRALNSLKSKFLTTSGGEVGPISVKGNITIDSRYGAIFALNSEDKYIAILSNVYDSCHVGDPSSNLTLKSKAVPKWNNRELPIIYEATTTMTSVSTSLTTVEIDLSTLVTDWKKLRIVYVEAAINLTNNTTATNAHKSVESWETTSAGKISIKFYPVAGNRPYMIRVGYMIVN